ncbi:MAG: hypothetical protein ABI131_00855 [Nostocoides sp.]
MSGSETEAAHGEPADLAEHGVTRGNPLARVIDRLAVLAWTILLAGFVIVGADCLWVVAMGDRLTSGNGAAGGLGQSGLPFAAADSRGWPNPLVLAELLLAGVHHLGSHGLVTLQLLIVATVLAITASESRRLGASPTRAAGIVSLVVLGCLSGLVITRLPSLSLVPLVGLVALLRREHASPSRRIWWAVALLALWANLHGGVLIGVAILGAHLLLDRLRRRPVESIAVGAASLAALCATPAGLRTITYYRGVFDNEAAHRGSDLWAAPSLANPLDVLMLVAAVLFAVGAARAASHKRSRMPLWELVAALGLVVATVQVGRNGVWLVLFLAPAAARLGRVRALQRQGSSTGRAPESPGPAMDRGAGPGPKGRPIVAVAALVAVAAVSAILLQRGPAGTAPGTGQVAAIKAIAAGHPVLAVEPLAETLAAGGVTVWASNPLDAFARADQAAYLDFLAGGTVAEPAMAAATTAVAVAGTGQAAALAVNPGWRRLPDIGPYAVFSRAP